MGYVGRTGLPVVTTRSARRGWKRPNPIAIIGSVPWKENDRHALDHRFGSRLRGVLFRNVRAAAWYNVTDLGTLGGFSSSDAMGINASGQVVGYAQTGSNAARAFLYSDETMTDLGGFYRQAYDINDIEQMSGYATTVFCPLQQRDDDQPRHHSGRRGSPPVASTTTERWPDGPICRTATPTVFSTTTGR